MEHHIAQSSPISPRQKGMEGSRQALLYGVYDAFAGARSLISKRLCALITAIGIAVFTISSSAWATHSSIATPVNAIGTDTVIGGEQLVPNSVHSEDIGAGEVCGSGLPADCGVDDMGNLIEQTHIKENSIGNADLADGAVTGGAGGDIVDGSITSDDLQVVDPGNTPGAVNTNNIRDDAVDSRTIAEGEVCGSEVDCGADDGTGTILPKTHIRPGSIGTADIADGGVTGAVNPGTTPSDITPGSIGSADIADGSINGGADPATPSDIAAGTIGSVDLAPDAVSGGVEGSATPGNIVDGSITSADLADVTSPGGAAVDTANIVNGAVDADKLDSQAVSGGDDNAGIGNIVDNSITSTDLKSVETDGTGGAVSTDKIDDDAILSEKIAAGEICGSADTAAGTTCETGNNHIGAGSIDTPDLANNAVTNGKILDNAVTTGKIRDETVTGSGDNTNTMGDIARETITENEIRDGAIRSEEIRDGEVTGSGDDTDTIGDIARETITANEIRDDAVGRGELQANAVCGSGDPAGCGETGGAKTHIKAGSIGTGDLTDLGVTTEKLARVDDQGRGGAVSNNNINDGAITFRKIGRDAVGSIHIQERAVRGNHIDNGQIGLRHLDEDVNKVFRRIEGAIDRLDEGIAMSHAISMIKVPQGKEFGISFAGGFYQDKQAAAIGIGFRPTDGLLLSAGASYGFDSEEVGGAVSINFGF